MEMVPVPNAKPFSRHDQFDFPPGYRFCPFDHELILYYLKRKVNNQILPPNKIEEVNLYKYSPEELSEMYPTLGEKEWYFFTPRDRKYRNGQRPNRAAGRGYWKATGADKRIKHHGGAIGLRKALVYYEGKPPKGDKTNWIMHEYRVMGAPPPTREGVNDMRLDDWVLCRIYKKAEKLVKCARKTENFEPVTPPAHNNQDDHNLSVTNLQKEESIVTAGVYREVMEEVQFPFLPREIMPHYSDIELMHDQFNQDYQNLNNLYDDTFNYSNMFVDQNSDDQMLL